MPVELTDKEIETVRALLHDWGWEFGLACNRLELAALAKKLKMPLDFIRDLES